MKTWRRAPVRKFSGATVAALSGILAREATTGFATLDANLAIVWLVAVWLSKES